MRGGLRGDGQALRLGLTYQLDRSCRRQMEEVDTGTEGADQGDVPGHHHLFRHCGHAGKPQPARPCSLVHRPVSGQGSVLTVLGQGDTEAGGVVERSAHQSRRLHPGPVIGEEPNPEGGQLGHGRQALAGPTHRDRPGHRHFRRCRGCQLLHVSHRLCRIESRLGVGHGHYRGVTAEGGSPGARLDGFRLLPARLAEMGVEVDQTRGDDAALGLEHHRALRPGDLMLDGRHPALCDQDVRPTLAVVIDHRPTPDHHRRGAPGRPGAINHGVSRRGSPDRGGGTGQPSGWRPRCSPGR